MIKFTDEQNLLLVQAYDQAKCTFLHGPYANGEILAGLLLMTNGNACKDCGDKMLDNCRPVDTSVIKRIIDEDIKQQMFNQSPHLTMTNAELAEELGISKRQVSKMRKRNEL